MIKRTTKPGGNRLSMDECSYPTANALLNTLKELPKSQRNTSIDLLIQAITDPDSVKVQLNQVRDIVPMKEWIRDRYYIGPEYDKVYKFWEEVLVEFDEGNYKELILSGSLRSGKSYTADVLAIRKKYELSCYKSIPALFDLSKSSQLVFIYLATSVRQAFLQGLGRIRRIYDQIPYFQEVMPRDLKIESMLKYRNREDLIFLGGSEIGHFIGSDLFMIILDEANFVKGAISDKFARAVNIYRESKIRRQSTFMVQGKEHGCGVIVSSADTESSFVEQRKIDANTDPGILVVDAVAYEVQPWKYKGVGRFGVYSGDEYIDPFLLEDKDALINFLDHYNYDVKNLDVFDYRDLNPEHVEKFRMVPDTFIDSFRLDIYGALKEVCGVAIAQQGRFFTNRSMYTECFAKELEFKHPFTKQSIVCSYLDDNQLFHYFKPKVIKFKPYYEYYGHIDQSLSNDNTGAALVHFDPSEEDPKIHVDFGLEVNPPPKPSKISPEKVAKLFVFCRDKGANTISVSADQKASDQSIQTLDLAGMGGVHFSVDRDWKHYKTFAGLILTGQIVGYHYEPFRKELFSLIQDNDRQKIDHPPEGSKDVSDALCGACCRAYAAIKEIKTGVRYWPELNYRNIYAHKVGFNVKRVCGMFQDAESIYGVWVHMQTIEDVDDDREVKSRVFIDDEFIVHRPSASNMAKKFNGMRRSSEGEMVFAMNVYADPGHDKTQSGFARRLRKHHVSVRTRKKLDINNLESIRMLMADKKDPKLLFHPDKTPFLWRAFREAKYKVINGVRVTQIERNETVNAIYALRIALEELLLTTSAEGY